MKIALVCSHGGHLTELMYLAQAFEGANIIIISYDNPRTRAIESKKYLFPNMGENLFEIIKNIPKMFSILLNEKPDIIISNGAELAIPFFYIAKLLRIKSVFIESYTRIDQPTITGRLVYPVSNLFLVLWPEMLRVYGNRAKYWGGLFITLPFNTYIINGKKGGILVFTGMHSVGFYRLIKKMDEIANTMDEEVTVQIGHSDYIPHYCNFFTFKGYDEIQKMIEQSRIVICQGAMTVIDSLMLGAPVIAVPRLKIYNEALFSIFCPISKSHESSKIGLISLKQ